MVILGKQADRMSGAEGEPTAEEISNLKQFFLGKISGQTNTELDVDKNLAVFDTNNINKYVPDGITKGKVKLASGSFINDAKFYTCSENAQDALCFRCVDECVACVLCHDGCNGCQTCDSACHSCNGCNTCNGCNSCHSYADGSGH